MTSMFTKLLAILMGIGVLAAPYAGAVCPDEALPGSVTCTENRHNLSSNATHGGVRSADPLAGGTDQICIFCHTPHGAAAEGPLWNRNAPSGPFPLYSGALAIKGTIPGALNANAPNSTKYRTTDPGNPTFVYPNGASRLCMSCHDGVTAINILRNSGSIAMIANATKLDPDGSLKGILPNIGIGAGTAIHTIIDLSTSHPISFVYNDNIVENIINPAYLNSSPPLPDRYLGPKDFVSIVDTPLDSESRMQCTTCHDPHFDTSLVDGTLPPFWRQTTATGTGSATPYEAVCNNCHDTVASPLTPVHPPINPALP